MTYSFEYHICLPSKEAYTSMNVFVFPYWGNTNLRLGSQRTNIPKGNQMN